ncbi:hypothetical protein J8273_0953 [Carpediemonas membranifera]|uniref:Uncharacterized protein n=1 Tax=Carpediemonas membranifera TaxID=201153 RepID=A0A8J6BCP9_9EUKA|nr:hypothetical protein J8273_0953 [Carpediemonas membranifera]|eukprot:KAG9397457.1 hypothetical protein J8273_0953 [Carpediemonas membranifera]
MVWRQNLNGMHQHILFPACYTVIREILDYDGAKDRKQSFRSGKRVNRAVHTGGKLSQVPITTDEFSTPPHSPPHRIRDPLAVATPRSETFPRVMNIMRSPEDSVLMSAPSARPIPTPSLAAAPRSPHIRANIPGLVPEAPSTGAFIGMRLRELRGETPERAYVANQESRPQSAPRPVTSRLTPAAGLSTRDRNHRKKYMRPLALAERAQSPFATDENPDGRGNDPSFFIQNQTGELSSQRTSIKRVNTGKRIYAQSPSLALPRAQQARTATPPHLLPHRDPVPLPEYEAPIMGKKHVATAQQESIASPERPRLKKGHMDVSTESYLEVSRSVRRHIDQASHDVLSPDSDAVQTTPDLSAAISGRKRLARYAPEPVSPPDKASKSVKVGYNPDYSSQLPAAFRADPTRGDYLLPVSATMADSRNRPFLSAHDSPRPMSPSLRSSIRFDCGSVSVGSDRPQSTGIRTRPGSKQSGSFW